MRPTVARIDLGALEVQLPADRRASGAGSRRAARLASSRSIKANAYGHGAGQVARALEDAGADLLACADIEEGAALRAAGVRAGDSRLRRARASAISTACSTAA